MAMQDEKIKWVEGTPFMVDGFRFANDRCQHYLLTHFHSDHTTGLYKSFSAGTIYASQGTANLVTALIGVNPERVVALPMNTAVTVVGFEITLVDANHCPAAVMFIIRDPRPGGRVALHTGDFRADKSVCSNPIVKALKGQVDYLYLDTTYCGPKHAFPEQQEVLAQAGSLVRMELKNDPNTLFLVGTYSIGKERVLEAVAKAASSRCLVTAPKARILRLSGAWDDSVYTTHEAGSGGVDGAEHARVRAVPLQVLHTPTALLGALAEAQASGAPFTSVVGIRPTGWTHHNSAKEGEQVAKESAKRARVLETKDTTASAPPLGVGPGLAARESEVDREAGDQDEASQDFFDRLEDRYLEGQGDDLDHEPAPCPTSKFSDEVEGDEMEQEQGSIEEEDESGVSAADEWTGGKPRHMGENTRVHSLPYSEHSSYVQLKDFVRTVRPRKIIPTVNASSGPAVEKLLKYFLEFMDLSHDRKRLDSYFCRPSPKAKRTGDVSAGMAAPSPSGVSSTPPPASKRTRSDDIGSSGSSTAADLEDMHGEGFAGNNGAEGAGHVHVVAGAGGTTAGRPSNENDGPIGLPPPPRLRCLDGKSDGGVRSFAATAATLAPDVVVFVDVGSESSERSSVVHVPAETCTNTGGGRSPSAIELDLVDVEAQKAILADIERRRKLSSNSQDEKPRPPSTAVQNPYAPGRKGGTRRINSTGAASAGSTNIPREGESRRLVAGRGVGGGQGGASKKVRSARIPDEMQTAGKLRGRDGGCGPGAGRVSGRGTGVTTKMPGTAGNGPGQQGAVARGGGEKSNSFPANIRDFFGRRT